MTTLWISPTEYVTGDPSLVIGYPFVSHPSTVVTSKTTGDFKWVSVGLRLPPSVSIEEVTVCYQVSNPQSFISQVRLVEMDTPEQAVVIHDDGTDLKSTTPTCYTSHVGGKVPTPGTAVTLALRLNFHHTNHRILLGAVGVAVQSTQLAEQACLDTIADLRALAPGAVKCPTVLGYHVRGDGGGGNFYWDPSSNELENGGTVIVPNSSPATGRWKRLVDGNLSAKVIWRHRRRPIASTRKLLRHAPRRAGGLPTYRKVQNHSRHQRGLVEEPRTRLGSDSRGHRTFTGDPGPVPRHLDPTGRLQA